MGRRSSDTPSRRAAPLSKHAIRDGLPEGRGRRNESGLGKGIESERLDDLAQISAGIGFPYARVLGLGIA